MAVTLMYRQQKEFSNKVFGMYGMSLYSTLKAVYPEVQWEAWKFAKSPNMDIEDQRRYFSWLGQQLGIQKLEDWYQQSSSSIVVRTFANSRLSLQQKRYGYKVIGSYGGSLIAALKSIYPEFNWLPWKFLKSPSGWNDIQNKKEYITWLGKQLGVEKLEDWYQQTASGIKAF